MSADTFTFNLLAPATFPDFERLFAPVKGCSGCWCMYYRLDPKRWKELQGDGHRVQAEFAWTGPLKIYEEAGFRAVRTVNPLRPVVRKVLGGE